MAVGEGVGVAVASHMEGVQGEEAEPAVAAAGTVVTVVGHCTIEVAVG